MLNCPRAFWIFGGHGRQGTLNVFRRGLKSWGIECLGFGNEHVIANKGNSFKVPKNYADNPMGGRFSCLERSKSLGGVKRSGARSGSRE
ncbi:hypothetical protein M407DRAFT_246370 [Tulasnella calospora MUT 4182]|uniref:Uncharacterized protein n=1 Tax=Tulasnella calospora MUT 4182 TaxID=1051891 RepID=A0A0C3KBR6_9AGAM|nr:hypothetical protein M407DRAFT_246370 [Tulasnella calospora MUT 4182]